MIVILFHNGYGMVFVLASLLWYLYDEIHGVKTLRTQGISAPSDWCRSAVLLKGAPAHQWLLRLLRPAFLSHPPP